MKEVTLYRIKVEGEISVGGENSTEAMEQAQTWIKRNPEKLNYTYITNSALVKGKEE
jgi:hypothetical protein